MGNGVWSSILGGGEAGCAGGGEARWLCGRWRSAVAVRAVAVRRWRWAVALGGGVGRWRSAVAGAGRWFI
nr:hypothetical protein Itr_chr06CG00050 [Ipomoea trifida]GMD10985.1 hypothetical protein Iba_chr06fCG0030 [Ipomoea batatas]